MLSPGDPAPFVQLVDWLQEEHGPVAKSEMVAALEELDEIDAEHERRAARV